MTSAWDQVIGSSSPLLTPDPAFTVPGQAKAPSDIEDFLGHFFFETRTNYERFQTNFTGNPTYADVINAPNTGVFNPAGIPSLIAFLPSANRLQSFIDFGTRGYGSDRVNTHVAVRYRQDLSAVPDGSPSQNILNQFGGHRLWEVLDASVEVNSKPTDGIWAGTSLQFGRLNVYGAELASFDGGAVSVSRPRFDLTLFGGRRFSYFSDPVQRAIGGANLNLKLAPGFSLELDSLWYLKGSNRMVVRKRLTDRWLLTGSLRSYGGNATDLYVNGFYTSRNGRDTLRLGFFQKLSSHDYTYDFTSDIRDQLVNSEHPQYRLYLGPIPVYSQFDIEGHRQILRRLRAGAEIIVRRLRDEKDQGPFATSFEDYRFSGQYFPFSKIETTFEYHQRNSDRLSPANVTLLDDVSTSGETSVKDMIGQVRRSFGEGRFSLSGGVYYRRISMQDQFFYINNIHQSGVLGSAWVRFDRRTRAYFDYSLDNDFFLFRPDIKNSQVIRIGLNWKY